MTNLKLVLFDEKYKPQKANNSDACYDLKIRIDHPSKKFLLQPNGKKVFGTGIKVAIPDGKCMKIYSRSSLGIKRHCKLMNDVAIIDAGYRDEIKLAIWNFGTYTEEFFDGERVAQFEITDIENVTFEEVADDDNFKLGNRGGGIGSSGK
mgnify:CR=1 FL=1